MNKLSFWHKLAFIANCCWLAAWAMRYKAFFPEGDVRSTVLVTGLVLSYGLNLLANGWALILLLGGRLRANAIPRWLLIVNFLFLLVQYYLFFKS
jgi:hypothetical protein